MPQTSQHRAAVINKWDLKKGHSPLSLFARAIDKKVSDATLHFIDTHCFTYNIRKGAHLLKAGDVCEYMFLILKGAFRSYIKEGSKELITWISFENEMITSIRALNGMQPSIENIQALEDSQLIGASYTDLQQLYSLHLDFNIVGRKLIEQYCVDAEERSYIVKMGDAAEKYDYFMRTKGEVADRIPFKFVASYLGMATETFSRMHNKAKETK